MNYKTAMKYLELMMEEHQDVLLRLKNNGPEYYNNFQKPIDNLTNLCYNKYIKNKGENK